MSTPQNPYSEKSNPSYNMIITWKKPSLVSIISIPFLLSHTLVKAQFAKDDEHNQLSSPDPLYTGVTITLFTIAFVLLYLVFYYFLNHCFRRPASVRPGAEFRAPEACGLDPDVLGTFPVFKYSSAVDGVKLGKRSLDCAVCLSAFEEDETLRLLPACGHVFHVDCVDTWLATHSTCPYCRAELEGDFRDESTQGSEERVEVEEEVVVIEEANDVVVEETQAAQQEIEKIGCGWRGGKLWKWSSTGHVARGDRVEVKDGDTRLPEEVHDDVVTGRLRRSRSCIGVTYLDV